MSETPEVVGEAAIKFVPNFDDLPQRIEQDGEKNLLGPVRKLAALVAGAFAVTKGVQFFKDAFVAASDLNESVSKSENIFGAASGQIKQFADQADRIGLGKQQALEAASNIALFGRTAGLTGQDLADFSQKLTGLGADLASFNNTSIDQALGAIQAGLRGESEPLRAFGVLLDEQTLKARAVSEGIVQTTVNTTQLKQAQLAALSAQKAANDAVAKYGADSDEARIAQEKFAIAQEKVGAITAGKLPGQLTQAQRVQAAYAEILAQTSVQQGDFDRTASGAANATRSFSAVLQNLKTDVGQALLPLGQAIFPALATALDAIKPALVAISGAIGPALTPLVAVLGPVAEAVGKIFTAALPILGTLLGAVAPLLTALLPLVDVVTQLATGFAQALLPVVQGVVNVFTALAPVLAPILAQFSTLLVGVLQPLGAALGTILTAVGQALVPVFAALLPVIVQLTPVFTQLATQLADLLVKVVVPILPALGQLLVAFVPLIPPLAQLGLISAQLLVALAPLIQLLADGLARALVLITPYVTRFVNVLADLLNEDVAKTTEILGELAGVVSDLADTLRETVTLENFRAGLEKLGQIVTDLPGKIANLGRRIKDGLGDAADAVGRGLKGAGEAVLRFFEDLPGKAADLLKQAGSALYDAAIDLVATLIAGSIKGQVDLLKFFAELPVNLVRLIVDGVPALVRAGVRIVESIGSGASDQGRSFLTFFVELPGKIIRSVIDDLPRLVQLGFDLMNGIGRGVDQVTSTFFDFFKRLPRSIINVVGDVFNTVTSIGHDIIYGILEGIRRAASDLFGFLGGVVGDLVKSVLKKLGIQSPSTVFADIGHQMMAGLAVGIGGGATLATGALDDAVGGLTSARRLAGVVGAGGGLSLAGGGQQVNIAAGAVQIDASGATPETVPLLVQAANDAVAQLAQAIRVGAGARL